MNKIFSIISLILLLVGVFYYPLYAEGTRGISGADFLELSTSVRAMGMGETGCAVLGDLNNAYYNPALASGLNVQEASFSHHELISDSRFETVMIGWPLSYGTVYSDSAMFWVPPFDKIDVNGEKTGSVNFMNSVIGVGYAMSFSTFSVGVKTKYIYQRIDTLTTHSAAVDIGVLQRFSVYSPLAAPPENLTIGVSFQNFGTRVENDPLPRKFRSGVSYQPSDWARLAIDLNENLIDFSDSYDFTYGFNESFEMNCGAEFDYMDLIFFRAGYRLNDGGTYTFGSGFYYAIQKIAFKMDIAIANTREFGPVYAVGFSIQLAPKVSFSDMRESDRLYREGIEAFVRDDYESSLQSFKKAKSLNPYNKSIDRKIDDIQKLKKLQIENSEEESASSPEVPATPDSPIQPEQ